MHTARVLNLQLGQILDGPGQYGFLASDYDRPLDEFGMGGHDLEEVGIGQVFVCYEFAIGGFFGAQDILRLQSGAAEKVFQFVW